MRELDDLMIELAQVRRRLSRGHLGEVWSGADPVTSWLQLDELVLDKERQRQMRGEELAMRRMDGHMEVGTFDIQTEHVIRWPHDRREHAKILVGRLALDRGLVEAAEGMDNALLALAWRRMHS